MKFSENRPKISCSACCGAVIAIVICTIFSLFWPGSIQFLSGRRKTGISIFVFFNLNFIGFRVTIGIPGSFYAYITLLFLTTMVVVLLYAALSSWRYKPKLAIFNWLLAFVLFALGNVLILMPIDYCLSKYVVVIGEGSGRSMFPTLKDDSDNSFPDRYVINKFIYRNANPSRGDIVAWEPPFATDKLFAKRVVGLPGDTVDIVEPNVIINGEVLKKPEIFGIISARINGYSGYIPIEHSDENVITFPLKLKENEYFLLGDNATDSWDSRYSGPASRNDIVGRVVRIIYPLTRYNEL